MNVPIYVFNWLLGIVFVTLKLCNVIGWSWWWVTAPFWVPEVIQALIYVAVFVVYKIKRR
ncbi:hypothetical protein J6Z39_09105 [bacterium]|nr:hypothetical protein [bacterium]MBP5435961.1 hypothetical protein [bacterium]